MNKQQGLRQLVISSAAYSLSSILGPLLVLALPAYFLDRHFQTKPLLTLIAVGIAFVITNILLFKKVSQINNLIAKNFPLPKEKKTEEEDSGKMNDFS